MHADASKKGGTVELAVWVAQWMWGGRSGMKNVDANRERIVTGRKREEGGGGGSEFGSLSSVRDSYYVCDRNHLSPSDHSPQPPWFLTRVTAPCSRQSNAFVRANTEAAFAMAPLHLLLRFGKALAFSSSLLVDGLAAGR